MALPANARTWLAMLALVAATLATYAYAGRCEYVGMDDFGYVTQNPHVLTGLTLDGVRYAFTTFDLANWHPLMWLSLMTTVSLFGPSAGPMHWTNVAIHLMSALVLFALVRQLTGTFWRAWLVAAIFAVHPTHVESVAWISERKDVQSVLFGLLSFYAWFDWVRTRRRVSWALAMVLAVLGLLSKPMLVTAPFVLLVLDFWPLCRFERLDRRVWPLVLEKLPLLALTIACSVVTVIAQRSHGAVQDLESFSVATRVANATVGYARYLGMIFWPVDLVAYYPHTRRPTVGLALGAVGLIVAVSVLSWRLRRTRPWWLVGWLWFLGTLVPVIGLVQVGGQSIADRYLYFPSIGITVIVAWELTALARRGRWTARAAIAATGVALAALGVVAARQVLTWRTSVTLFAHAERIAPNFVTEARLAAALLAERRYAEAEPLAARVVAARSDEGDTWVTLAGALDGLGRKDAAANAQRRAVELDPRNGAKHTQYGILLDQLGRADEAEKELAEGLRLAPDDAHALANWGTAMLRRGRTAEAVDHLRRAVLRAPGDAKIAASLADALAASGATDEAIAWYERSLAADPAVPHVWTNRGTLLASSGRIDLAVTSWERAIDLPGAPPEARRNLTAIAAAMRADGRAERADAIAARLARAAAGPPTAP